MAQRTSVEPGVQEWFHYEMPLEFFQLFLDRSTMGYTCAYFPDSDATLDEAQRRKIELVVRKLDTQAGDRILEIGSGWGNLTLKNAELGAHVTGMTMNPAHASYVMAEAQRRGLVDRVDIRVEEARLLPFPDRSFNKVVSLGTTEHIEDLRTLFAEVSRVLTDGGRVVHHAMTAPIEPVVPSAEEDFMRTYILPVGRLKTLTEYVIAFEEAHLEMIDLHSITDHYPLTLRAWLTNLEAAGKDKALRTGATLEQYNAQRLFVAGCVAAFEESHIFCYQQVLQKVIPGQYRRPLPAGRDQFVLDDGPSRPLRAPLLERPLVALEVGGAMAMWVEGVDGMLQPGEPPRHPDCTLRADSDTLEQVTTGKRPLVEAFLQGQVEVEGDLVAAVQVRNTLLRLGS
jgi:cyclopropane fatty-acyl-phospholipid synthase-like methyltransferase